MPAVTGFYTSPCDGLPHIMIVDEGEYLHYPASPDDMWTVLQRLPPDLVHGIPIIDYRLENDASAHAGHDTILDFPPARRDPYAGRDGIELLPGIHAACVGGSLHPLTHRLVLTAYVYDPALPDRAMWECYLRWRMLSILMHEVGHHIDLAAKRAPLLSEHDALEQTAETYQATWTTRIVTPYLHERYPTEVLTLEAWASEWAGHPLTMDDWVDVPRALPDEPNWAAPWRLVPAGMCLSHLAHAVAEGKSRSEVQDWYEGYLALQQLRW